MTNEQIPVDELLDVIGQKHLMILKIKKQWDEQAQRDGKLIKKLRRQIDEFHRSI